MAAERIAEIGDLARADVERDRSGIDDFLDGADVVDSACNPHGTVSETTAHLERLATIIAQSGREVVAMVAPDKSTIHPDPLPEGLAPRGCFDEYTEELWSSLAAADIPGYLDLRTLLRSESLITREPLYLRKDSHWDSRGSLTIVQELVDTLVLGTWEPQEVTYGGLGDNTGDLHEGFV
ncbi:MAG: hypothetical protein O2815_10185 [Actinomycetota bacterium]|nr:hypothetical protein [Actinomycetota bacterium]